MQGFPGGMRGMQQAMMGMGGGAPAREPLVKIKAGKLNASPISGSNKFSVTADPKKGWLIFVKGDDQMHHIQWKDRLTNDVVDDAIIFPGDATFTKVDTKREGDRVYLLQFNGSSRRFFFWMQDKDDSQDEELCKKMSDAIANPESVAAAVAEGGADAAAPGGAMSEQQAQLMQMLGMGGAGGGAGGGGGGVQSQDLQSILQSMGFPAAPAAPSASGAAPATPTTTTTSSTSAPGAPARSAPAPAAAAAAGAAGGSLTADDVRRAMAGLGAMAESREPPVSLNLLVNADEVTPELEDDNSLATLLPHLVEGQQNPDALRQVLRSPQLQQALSSLTGALQSDNFNSIMANFNLDPAAGADALARGDAVGAFLAALQAQADAEQQAEEGGGEASGGGGGGDEGSGPSTS